MRRVDRLGLALDALAEGDATLDELAARLLARRSSLVPVLEHGLAQSLVQRFELPTGTYYTLTPTGLHEVALGRQLDEDFKTGGATALLRTLGRVQSTSQQVLTREVRADEAPVLTDDDARDLAVDGLNQAYAEGRLAAEERDRRVAAALSARTFGELRAAAGEVVEIGPVAPDTARLWWMRAQRPADGGRLLVLLGLLVVGVTLVFLVGSCTVSIH
ncbi:MAG: DUF1707 domain-containing protein [Nocardioides sp.]